MAAACDEFLTAYKSSPQETSLLIKNYILNGVDIIEDLADKSVSGGRLNLYNSIQNLLSGSCGVGVSEIFVPIDNFNIYPNPGSDIIYLSSNNNYSADININIYDQTSRIVYSTSNFIFPNSENGIPVSNFPQGIYLIKILDTSNQTIFTSSFIIN